MWGTVCCWAQEDADQAALEVRCLQRAVEEGEEASTRLKENRAAAQRAKEAAQQVGQCEREPGGGPCCTARGLQRGIYLCVFLGMISS